MKRRRNRHLLFSIGLTAGLAAVRTMRAQRYGLQGKTVFITGGSRGLGLLLARRFAARGAKVAISARDRDALRRASDGLRQFGDDVLAIETDITMREEAESAVKTIRREFGPI